MRVRVWKKSLKFLIQGSDTLIHKPSDKVQVSYWCTHTVEPISSQGEFSKNGGILINQSESVRGIKNGCRLQDVERGFGQIDRGACAFGQYIGESCENRSQISDCSQVMNIVHDCHCTHINIWKVSKSSNNCEVSFKTCKRRSSSIPLS